VPRLSAIQGGLSISASFKGEEPTDERPRPATAISPLRQRLIDDMNVRRFSRVTQRNYICDIGRFATFPRRSPDAATADDVRRFQIEQRNAGVPTPTMNSIVSALRFFFTHTIDRPDLTRRLVRVAQPRNLPVVLSRDEVARLSPSATGCSGVPPMRSSSPVRDQGCPTAEYGTTSRSPASRLACARLSITAGMVGDRASTIFATPSRRER
jgi:hypothetical protein